MFYSFLDHDLVKNISHGIISSNKKKSLKLYLKVSKNSFYFAVLQISNFILQGK